MVAEEQQENLDELLIVIVSMKVLNVASALPLAEFTSD
jgi:hypothetical protein